MVHYSIILGFGTATLGPGASDGQAQGHKTWPWTQRSPTKQQSQCHSQSTSWADLGPPADQPCSLASAGRTVSSPKSHTPLKLPHTPARTPPLSWRLNNNRVVTSLERAIPSIPHTRRRSLSSPSPSRPHLSGSQTKLWKHRTSTQLSLSRLFT